MTEKNLTVTGDEARVLMVAMATSTASVPSQMTIKLWTNLNAISQVQPPTPQNEEEK